MNRKRKRLLSYVVLITTIFILIIVNLGSTFAYFVINGEIITSSFSGSQTFNGDYTVNRIPFTDTNPDSIAVLIESGNFKINNSSIEKSGDSANELLDGANSAIVVREEASLELFLGSVVTDGTYSHGIFADGGNVTVTGTTVKTNSSHSSGVVVSNNGIGTINYANLETFGNYSPAIEITSSGGTIKVNGGTVKTGGVDSPAIYSAGDVTVDKATVISSQSEGIIVEGKGKVIFRDSTLTSTDTTLQGQSDTYKNIFLYQSEAKNSDDVITFTASNNTMVTNKGDTFYITNTKAVIKLVNNVIKNQDGDFLRVEVSSWGQSGLNGGDVVLSMSNQSVSGNIIVDELSKLDISLLEGSTYQGAINENNTAEMIDLTLSSDSKIILKADSYVSSFTDEDTTYSNIDFSGYNLYVNGQKLVIGSGSSNDNDTIQENTTSNGADNTHNSNDSSSNNSQTSSSNSTIIKEDSSSNYSSSDSNTSKGDNSTGVSENISEQSNLDNYSETNDIVSDSTIDFDKEQNLNEELSTINNFENGNYQVFDDKTITIINVIGVILIITSIVFLVKNHKFKDNVDNT